MGFSNMRKPRNPLIRIKRRQERESNVAFYRAYMASDKWREYKRFVLAHRGNKCEVCSRAGEVFLHHRSYKNLGHEHPEDVVVLCGPCHHFIHFDGTRKIRVKPNNLIKREKMLRDGFI